LRRGTPFRPRGRLRCRAPPSPSRRGGIPPPKIKALCTVTEVTELSFRRKEHNSQKLVPAAKDRPSPRPPCGAEGYFIRCVVLGRFPCRAWYFFARCVIVDPPRCLAVLEGRRAPQSVRLGWLRCGTIFRPRGGCGVVPRRPRDDVVGIRPPPRNALCTVTELTELSFRRKEHTS
jgi:hypothetical protein